MAKKLRKKGKRAATGKSAQRRGPASKKPATAKAHVAARRPASASTSGSGLVYTDLLREALARSRGQDV